MSVVEPDRKAAPRASEQAEAMTGAIDGGELSRWSKLFAERAIARLVEPSIRP
jgi:hypothetical protein